MFRRGHRGDDGLMQPGKQFRCWGIPRALNSPEHSSLEILTPYSKKTSAKKRFLSKGWTIPGRKETKETKEVWITFISFI